MGHDVQEEAAETFIKYCHAMVSVKMSSHGV